MDSTATQERQEVSLAGVLDTLVEVFRRTAIYEDALAPEALALWLCHNHAFKAATHNPYLIISAPREEAGKTQVLSMVLHAAHNAQPAADPTPATLYRSGAHKAKDDYLTFVIDEADTGFFAREGTAGLLNSAWTKDFAQTMRCGDSEDGFKPEDFSYWFPFAFGMIGQPALRTLLTRCFIVRTRKAERAELEAAGLANLKQRLADKELLKRLGKKLHKELKPHLKELEVAEPDVPREIESGRTGDNVRLMLAVADLAGGRWPELARRTVVAICNPSKAVTEQQMEILQVASNWFAEMAAWSVDEKAKNLSKGGSDEIIRSEALLEELEKQRILVKWDLTVANLGKELRPLGLERVQRRITGQWHTVMRGYLKEDIEAALARFCPPVTGGREEDKESRVLPFANPRFT